MKLTRHDLSNIMKDFPNIELSYEKNIYNKVPSSNIYLSIPKGKKYFTWFRNWKTKSICLFLELDKQRKQIQIVTIKNVCFNDILCSGKGTILYGTLFHIIDHAFFNIENIYFLKGRNISSLTQYNKLDALQTILNNYIKPVIISKQDVAFGLPLIDTNHAKLKRRLDNLPYPIYCIQHRLLHKMGSFLNERVDMVTKHEYNFSIKATVNPDIYELYYIKGANLSFYKYASIPDYATSVFMNKIFRNIKENENLDTLEESDDEEEFENISEDKYVDLEMQKIFKCVYSKYHKSWKPLQNINILNDQICRSEEIYNIEKYNQR